MAVGEAVELGGRASGVRPHLLKVEPIAHVQDAVQGASRGDEVDTVAGRTPDGVFRGPPFVVMFLFAEDPWVGVLMVENDAREVAVDSVVQVQHV